MTKFFVASFVGLVLSGSVAAEPLLEGRVRLSSGEPVAGARVWLFDLSNVHWSVGTTTDEAGYFALAGQHSLAGTALPEDFALGYNYPNPFNPATIIPYQLPETEHVRLEVFNILGQRVAFLVDTEQPAGAHTARWDGTDASGRAVGAGVYIYRLTSGGQAMSRRMVLVDGQAGMPMAGAGPLAAVEEVLVAADPPVYGLAIMGDGLVTYMDVPFRVGSGEATIVVEPYDDASPLSMKRTAV